MSKQRTPISSRKGIRISDETRRLYNERKKSLDNDPDVLPLPPEQWAARDAARRILSAG